MTEPRSDDLLRSRQEAALLLRLDPQNLSASDALRCDLIATLRLSIDSAQADALDGHAADLGRLIVATESLVKLLPSEPPQSANKHADPRRIMWETYLGMRRRGEIGNAALEAREIDRLRARVAELEAQLMGHPPAESAPLPDNVVALPHATAGKQNAPVGAAAPTAPPKPEPPQPVSNYELAPPEPWRSFIDANGDINPTPGRKFWGPVV